MPEHDVSDEPIPEAVVKEVSCVAVSDGRCDCTRHPANDEMEIYRTLIQNGLMNQSSKSVMNELKNQHSKFTKLVHNEQMNQHLHWFKKSRWIKIQA